MASYGLRSRVDDAITQVARPSFYPLSPLYEVPDRTWWHLIDVESTSRTSTVALESLDADYRVGTLARY